MGCGSSSKEVVVEQVCKKEQLEKQPRTPQPSPPPPYILREMFYDIAADVPDVSDDSRATAKGIMALVREICFISGDDLKSMPKAYQVDEVCVFTFVFSALFGFFLSFVEAAVPPEI